MSIVKLYLFFILNLIFFSHEIKAVDYNSCDDLKANNTEIILGVGDGFSNYLINYSMLYDNVVICTTDFSPVFPSVFPWSNYSGVEIYYGWYLLVFSLLIAFALLKLLRIGFRVSSLVAFFILSWFIFFLTAQLFIYFKIPHSFLHKNIVLIESIDVGKQWHKAASLKEMDFLLLKNGARVKENFEDFKVRLISNNVSLKEKYQILQQRYSDTGIREINIIKIDLEGNEKPPSRWVKAEEISFELEPLVIKNKKFKPREILNVRKGPSKSYQSMGFVLSPSSTVKASGKQFGDWWEVTEISSDKTGWVNSLWLVPVAEKDNSLY